MRNLLLILTCLAALAHSQDRPRLHPQPPQSKNSKTGPEVGARIPAFQASDQNGRTHTFNSLRGPKGMLLVFTRSADWCPYCKTQMVDLNRQLESFRKQGLTVATITYDSTAILKHFAERQQIRYPMLSDPGSKIIRAFGIFNENTEKGTRAYGIPYPGIYVVDEKGVVKSKYFEDDYTERYSAASILTHEFGADGVSKTTIETPHLKLTTSASDAEFGPGRRIALIAEMDLKPGLHVYAPGVEYGYIPIAWTVAESKSWVAFPVAYPKARTMEFAALKEIVPVYEGKLRLVRDLTIGNEAEIAPALGADRTLTVEGGFRYQACDDRECFPPRTLPLKWTFKLGRLDTQRVPEDIQHK
jgi:peroxiredoxin